MTLLLQDNENLQGLIHVDNYAVVIASCQPVNEVASDKINHLSLFHLFFTVAWSAIVTYLG